MTLSCQCLEPPQEEEYTGQCLSDVVELKRSGTLSEETIIDRAMIEVRLVPRQHFC